MSRALCVRGCTYDDGEPRPAATGLEVCTRDEQQARTALRELPGLWADLGDTRRGQQPRNGSRSTEHAQPLSDDARAARSAIRAMLVSWCLVLEEDYDLTLPADTVRGMAHHVAVQAGRLLASEHADQLVHDVTTAAAEARRLAYPGRRMTIACSCGSRVVVDPDKLMVCPGCDTDGDLAWWQQQATAEQDARPLRLRELPDWLLLRGVVVTYEQIRSWADDGHLQPALVQGPTEEAPTAPRLYDGMTAYLIAEHRLNGRRPATTGS